MTVSDEGDGIAPENQPLVFTRFWHGSQRGGTGLGLYVVRGLVEAHGGPITVGRPPWRRPQFRFTLPSGAPEHLSDPPAAGIDLPVASRPTLRALPPAKAST